jgi:hypothetical protein
VRKGSRAGTEKHLVQLLTDEGTQVVTAVIQKFSVAVSLITWEFGIKKQPENCPNVY